MLTIYVYSPENPMLTRSDVGPVDATEAENKVTSLQIWIFESTSGNKVAYFEAKGTADNAVLNASEDGVRYQIPVSDDFAKNRPDVDVYVVANVESCGLSLGENTPWGDLQAATIGEEYFSGITTVPAEGLPMSGVLKNQPVIGEAPALRVGTDNQIATVPLKRAVSKVRFAFANTKSANEETPTPTLSIKSITINANMIPKKEFLFPQTYTLDDNDYVGWGSSETPLIPEVAQSENPTLYIYNGQEAQQYEDLIDAAAAADDGQLTVVGPYYFRESDKQIEGLITYQIGTVEQKKPFKMERAGDFLRNHSWIVYAYRPGGDFLQLVTLYVRNWTTLPDKDHSVYNW